jgi:hypothetical protein
MRKYVSKKAIIYVTSHEFLKRKENASFGGTELDVST